MIYRAIACKKACFAVIARKWKGLAQTKDPRQKGKAESLWRLRDNSGEGQVLNCCAGHEATVFSFSHACLPFFSIVQTKLGRFELVNSRTYFPGGALDDEPAGVAGGAERADLGVLK